MLSSSSVPKRTSAGPSPVSVEQGSLFGRSLRHLVNALADLGEAGCRRAASRAPT
jgi:hypothetical protein